MYNVTGFFPGSIHYLRDSTMYGSIKNRIYLSSDYGSSWDFLAEIPLAMQWNLISLSTLAGRLFRAGIRHLYPMNEILIIMGYQSIFTYNIRNKTFSQPAKITGSRPLTLCIAKDHLYYGEYWGNPKRRPIGVFCSKDAGLNWEEVYQFNHIRHIHGIFYDHYSDSIWITTGDEDWESAIWVTGDNFKTIRRVLHGRQQFRALTLLFTKDYIYFGSDTGREENYIFRYSKVDGCLKKLQRVESAVFYGCVVGKELFFSTVCQPSKVNETKQLSVWRSTDGETWTRLITFRKDIWPKKLFQYGQILFPAGEGLPGTLWLTAVALQDVHGSIKVEI